MKLFFDYHKIFKKQNQSQNNKTNYFNFYRLTKLETLISTNNKSFQQTFDSLDSHEIKTDFLTEA